MDPSHEAAARDVVFEQKRHLRTYGSTLCSSLLLDAKPNKVKTIQIPWSFFYNKPIYRHQNLRLSKLVRLCLGLQFKRGQNSSQPNQGILGQELGQLEWAILR